jgi:HEPN domain-containing protein
MLRVYAHEYIALGERIHDFRAIDWDREDGLADDEKEDLKLQLRELLMISKNLRLPVSADLIKERLSDLPNTMREFDVIVDVLRSELRTKLFLFVPQHRAKYYNVILPSIVTVAFPSASEEIVSASNSLAAGLYTASVFHAMRAAEIGLRSLAAELGVSFPFDITLANWQNMIEQIESKIGDMKKRPKGIDKEEDLQFYSESATQFRYFKDAWRVRVAHARAIYEEHQAISVVDHVMSFFTRSLLA